MIDTAFEEKLVKYSPVPVVVVNSNGKVVRANDLIGTVFIYDELTGYDFFQLTGFKVDDLKDRIEDTFDGLEDKIDDLKDRIEDALDGDDDGDIADVNVAGQNPDAK